MLGLGLLIWLLLRIDIKGAWQVLTQVKLSVALLAAAMLLPLIGLKSLRWLIIIGQPVSWRSYYEGTLSYFSGLFLGFLTPGRLGEFIRVIYARRRLDGDTARGTISVLADRSLDLAALLIFGGAALLRLPGGNRPYFFIGWGSIFAGTFIPLILLILSMGNWWNRLIEKRDLSIGQIRLGYWLGSLAQFKPTSFLIGIPLTAAAYALFFWQGSLLMESLAIQQNYLVAAFTLSLAGLVALLPISISGLGTREWVITLYLGTQAVSAEQALAFSALVFLAFNIWGSLLGGISWLLYPESFKLDPDTNTEEEAPADLAETTLVGNTSGEGG